MFPEGTIIKTFLPVSLGRLMDHVYNERYLFATEQTSTNYVVSCALICNGTGQSNNSLITQSSCYTAVPGKMSSLITQSGCHTIKVASWLHYQGVILTMLLQYRNFLVTLTINLLSCYCNSFLATQ